MSTAGTLGGDVNPFEVVDSLIDGDFEVIESGVETTASPENSTVDGLFGSECHYSPAASVILNSLSQMTLVDQPTLRTIGNDSLATSVHLPVVNQETASAAFGSIQRSEPSNETMGASMENSQMRDSMMSSMSTLRSDGASSGSTEFSNIRQIEEMLTNIHRHVASLANQNTSIISKSELDTLGEESQAFKEKLTSAEEKLMQKDQEIASLDAKLREQSEAAAKAQEERERENTLLMQEKNEKIEMLLRDLSFFNKETENTQQKQNEEGLHLRSEILKLNDMLTSKDRELSDLTAHHGILVRNNTEMVEAWQIVKGKMAEKDARIVVLEGEVQTLRQQNDQFVSGSLIEDSENKNKMITDLREQVDHLTAKVLSKEELLDFARKREKESGMRRLKHVDMSRSPVLSESVLTDMLHDKERYQEALEMELKKLRDELTEIRSCLENKDLIIQILQEENNEGTRVITEQDRRIKHFEEQLMNFRLERVEDNLQ